MNNIDLMNYWIDSSDEDYDTMKVLFKSHKNTWCLFIGHLVIEKLLKALYSKKNKNAPYAPKVHDLLYLTEKVDLVLTENQEKSLSIISKFNINARYDDYKKDFQNKCTDEYTAEQIQNIEEVRTWLKNLLTMN